MASTDPATVALRDQANAASRDARCLVDPRITEAFTTWLHETLAARGRAAGCSHHWTPQVLAVLIIGGGPVLCCLPCRTALIELAGPSQQWICDRCRRTNHRGQRHPVDVTAAIGPVLAHVKLCVYCAFDLGISYNPPQPKGSPA
jgi:hypothetical protein